MRIAHVIESAGGGSGRMALSLIDAQMGQGHDVALFYAPRRMDEFFQRALRRASNLRTVALPMRREVGVHDVMDGLRLFQALRRTGPFDIIHSHSAKAGGLARIAGLPLRARQIYSPHAFATMDAGANPLYGKAERVLSRLCRAVVAASSEEMRHALGLGIAEKKLRVIPNGVTDEAFGRRELARLELGADANDFVIGYVGRLTPQKNPLRALAAFGLAWQREPRLRLAIIGDGPLKNDMQAIIATSLYGNRVRFHDVPDARRLMPGFDGLLCSSDYEGFPVSFIEALTAGVPIVTTPVGGAAEAVIPGMTGFIAEHFTPAALAAGLLLLSALPSGALTERTARIKAHARHFTAERMAAQVMELYREVLGKKRL